MNFPPAPAVADFQKGVTYTLKLASGHTVPVRWSDAPFQAAQDAVLIHHPSRLDPLSLLDDYPHIRSLLNPAEVLARAKQRKAQVREWLSEGIHMFGAYKVGLKLARQALASGVAVKGFLDNDRAKQGSQLEGIPVQHPSGAPLENAVVVIASGRHGNAIHKQLSQMVGVRLVNMHEFLYALDGPHGPGPFRDIVEAPACEPWRFISAFLRLDDERSREVFDALIGMRTQLSIAPADQVKSPYDEEYFDKSFVTPVHASRFADAGAAAGDTLRRLEEHFCPVEQAWLFEPELPPYYEALKRFAERPNVWLFNMGLDEAPSRAIYQPVLSYDIAGEMNSEVPACITSYIQGVPLDAIVSGKVGLFKLDIEGMEARALRGARGIIARDKPVLAVCAYHRADDYWRLMDEVLCINPGYRVAIRLYADILEDITLYFY
jgi:FkbM family methyltransferase